MTHPGTSSDLLRGLLTPLSAVYGAAVAARNSYYDRVPSASHTAGIPVISVGNLTVGGTGKTPLTIEIVRRLRAAGRRPAILTRGYGAAGGETADEVLEFEVALPDLPVVVNADRVAGAVAARRDHGADCLVLDDGFQHRRLRRDLDVVLVDALDWCGGGRVLPAGRLREPLSSLGRADWIVITRCNQVEPSLVQDVVTNLHHHAPDVPVVKAAIEAERLVGLRGASQPAEALAERRILPVCGLGNPATFLRLIERRNERACEPLVFADHQRYSRADVKKITDTARQRGAEWVVTTRKDWVKLHDLWPLPDPAGVVPLFRLDVRLVMADPRGEFDTRLQGLFEENA